MTSVPNLLQPLSGNRLLGILAFLLLTSGAAQAGSASDTAAVEQKDRFTISFILPLKLDELDTLNAPGASDKFQGNTLGLDFWQGANLAIDTLTSLGLNLTVNVLDNERKGFMMSSSAILDKLGQSDLVIGPVFPESFKSAALFSSTYKIPLVSPLSPSSLAAYQNPYFIGMYPTIEHHAQADACYIKQNFGNEKVVVLQTSDPADLKMTTPFVAELQRNGKTATVVKVNKTTPDFAAFDKSFPPNKRRVIVMASTNPMFITSFYNHLKEDTLNETVVFTHPNFDKTENLNIDLVQRMNTYTSSAYDVDYTNPKVIEFVRKYREVYGTDPSETAIRAYGIVWYFGKVFQISNTDFFNNLDKFPMQLLYTKVMMERNEITGYHNTGVQILKYQDYDLVEQK